MSCSDKVRGCLNQTSLCLPAEYCSSGDACETCPAGKPSQDKLSCIAEVVEITTDPLGYEPTAVPGTDRNQTVCSCYSHVFFLRPVAGAGGLAGIIAGIVAALILLGLLLFFFVIKPRLHKGPT